MMPEWIAPSPAERRLLGAPLLRGPTPWVIAIMSFSIFLIAATGLALANTSGVLSRAIDRRYAAELPSGGSVDLLAAALRSTPGVVTIQPISEREMRDTLERWLGPAAKSGDLPVPALVNFDIAADANLAAIEQHVRAAAPGASVIAHRDSVAPLLRSLRLLQGVTLGLVLLLSGACSAAVVLAARGALDTHRSTIDVMHGIGATDIQVTRLFQRKIGIDALVGSIAGALAAALVLLLLASGAAFAGELIGGATLSGTDLLLLALVPLALTALATAVARAAVLRALREAL